MTNKELQGILAKHPPNMQIQVWVSSFISEIVKVDKCVDMDTNKMSLVIYGQDRDYFKRRVSEVISKKFGQQ